MDTPVNTATQNNITNQGNVSYPTVPSRSKFPSFKKNMNGEKKSFWGAFAGFAVALTLIVLVLLVISKRPGSSVLNPFSNDGGTGQDNSNKIMEPLTGIFYSEKESEAWKDVRPLAVMINNHTSARPQSGLAEADLVYEIVAEGGITRYLSFFHTTIPEKIGPVRSTREYYLVLVKELGDAMIMHIGWSPQALTAIETWPVRSLGRGGGQFWRDQDRLDAGVPTEHTAYVDGKELIDLGMDLGWEGTRELTSWQFKDNEDPAADCGDGVAAVYCEGTVITIDFWYEGDYSSIFTYNKENNSYLKHTGYDSEGNIIPTKDQETDKQVEVKNLIVQYVPETPIIGDDKSRLEYQLVGSGEATIFVDGKTIQSTWAKSERDERTRFYDLDGNEIQFNRGRFWIAVVPERNMEQVTY